MSKVYVSRAGNLGEGIFAKTDIKKDEIIFIVKGSIKKNDYSPKSSVEGPNWLALAKHKWISPFDDNPWRYINHSCKPNAGLKGKVTVVAMKNIKKNEQITIDYSITEDDPYWKMKCNCGQKNCRKIIRSVRFLSPSLFKKYKEYIPKFLRKEYVRANNFFEFTS